MPQVFDSIVEDMSSAVSRFEAKIAAGV